MNADEGSNHLANAHKPNAYCYVDERIRPGGRLLDHGKTVAIGPDLIWYDRGDKPSAVIDAEYEMIAAGKSGPNAYMYKSTAYFSAVGPRKVHLIHAKSYASRAVDIVGAYITICCRALDPTPPPSEFAGLD